MPCAKEVCAGLKGMSWSQGQPGEEHHMAASKGGRILTGLTRSSRACSCEPFLSQHLQGHVVRDLLNGVESEGSELVRQNFRQRRVQIASAGNSILFEAIIM